MFPFQNYKLYRTNSSDSQLSPQKNVIILVKSNLSKEEEQLLNKILQSVDLDIEAVEIIIQDSNKNYDASLIIGFGLPSNKKYEVIKSNGLTELYADSLGELNNSVELKKQLWTQLKKLNL